MGSEGIEANPDVVFRITSHAISLSRTWESSVPVPRVAELAHEDSYARTTGSRDMCSE